MSALGQKRTLTRAASCPLYPQKRTLRARKAMKWGAVNRNVAALVDPPKVDRVEMRTLDVDQATTMIELARGSRSLSRSY